jgi:hypothetical protein
MIEEKKHILQNNTVVIFKGPYEFCEDLNGFGSVTIVFPGDIEVKFVGHMRNGCREGFGEMIYASGVKYTGTYHNGVKHCQGLVEFTDDSKFFGEFREGFPCGFGMLLYGEDTSMCGVFHGNYELSSGYVELNFPNQSYYGDFDGDSGVANGQGEYCASDGFSYVGYFADGLLDGMADVCTPAGTHLRCRFDRGELVIVDEDAHASSSEEELEYYFGSDSPISFTIPLSPQGRSPRHDEEAKHLDLYDEEYISLDSFVFSSSHASDDTGSTSA